MTMTVKKSDNLLQNLRQERGWSQRRVANLLQEMGGIADGALVGKWERGEHIPSPFYQEKLCTLFGLTTHELGFIKQPIQPKTVSSNQPILAEVQVSHKDVAHPLHPPVLGYEGMFNKKRRELLQLLTVAATTLLLPNLDWERIGETISKPSYLDEAALCDLALINKSFWNLFKVTSQKKVMLDGVLGQLTSLTGFLEHSYTPPIHKQLCTLVSDLSQLLGEILFDGNDYDAARYCYSFAASAAKEANHYDLWACALVRHAFLPIYEGQHHDALPLLQGAQKLAYRGDTTLATRHWVAAVFSDAQAGVGNLRACQQTLDVMDRVREVKNSSSGGWLRFNETRLLEQRGACFVKLKQPELAIPVLQEALEQELTYRRRGIILTDLAFAYLQNGNVDSACNYADHVIEIAILGSGMLRKGVYSLRDQLSTYTTTSAVKKLDQQLQLLA